MLFFFLFQGRLSSFVDGGVSVSHLIRTFWFGMLLFVFFQASVVGCGGEPVDTESPQESSIQDAGGEQNATVDAGDEQAQTEKTQGTEDTQGVDATGDPNQVFLEMADPVNCKAGQITEYAKHTALKRVNDIRKIHGLAPVEYNTALDKDVMEAALIIVANSTITHYPKASAACYSEAANNGSGKSNIGIKISSSDSPPDMASVSDKIDGWLRDDRNVQPGVGHRRWILNPFLKHVAFGYAYGKSPNPTKPGLPYVTGSALYVLESKTNISTISEGFVAYPYKEYPKGLWNKDTYLSFSVFYDGKSTFSNKEVDFSNANIEVKSSSKAMTVSGKTSNTKGSGLPNVMIWKVEGLQSDVKYDVSITKVMVKGQEKDYSYSFTLK